MLRQLNKLNLWKNYNCNLLCSTENLHTTALRFVEEKVEVMESQHISKINSMLAKYEPEQEAKILTIINNYDLTKLLGYEITKARANKLLAWRERHGLLKTLKDVLSVDGFSLKIAEKFFHSLLLEPKTDDPKLGKGQTRTAPFITPALDIEQRRTIKSAVSLRIGVNSVTWSRLEIPGKFVNAPCLLTHWQHHELLEKKLHINELIQRCLHINHLIPAADCYLFENPQMAQASNNTGSVEQQKINIQKSQVIAMLGYALASRRDQLYETDNINKTNNMPNVFYVRRLLSARLFNRLVGTERVSSEETILNMMRTFYNTDEEQRFPPKQIPGVTLRSDDDNATFSGHVQFPMELREMFAKASRYYREFLSQCLLLNLTFVRLVLLQDAESIATILRAVNNKQMALK